MLLYNVSWPWYNDWRKTKNDNHISPLKFLTKAASQQTHLCSAVPVWNLLVVRVHHSVHMPFVLQSRHFAARWLLYLSGRLVGFLSNVNSPFPCGLRDFLSSYRSSWNRQQARPLCGVIFREINSITTAIRRDAWGLYRFLLGTGGFAALMCDFRTPDTLPLL